MADQYPLKIARSDSGVASGIAEFQVGDVVPISRGGTGATSLGDFSNLLSVTVDASALNGFDVVGTPTLEQALVFNGTDWQPSTLPSNFSPIWNASALDGIDITGTPTGNQALVFNGTAWAPSTLVLGGGVGGSGVTAINSLTGPSVTINAVSGLAVSSGNNQVNIGANYTSAIWNASALSGVIVSGIPSIAGQVLAFSNNAWAPSAISFPAGGNGVTAINSLTGPSINVNAVSGLAVSSGNNQVNIGANYTSAIWNASALSGVLVSGIPSIAGQVLAFSNNAWAPSSISFPAGGPGGSGVTAINSVTGPAITLAGSGGTLVSAGNNQINLYSLGKFASSIGDNSATSFTVTHNLGSQDFIVNVYSVASPFTQVRPTIKNTSTTTATLEFTVAPTTNQYRVVIIG